MENSISTGIKEFASTHHATAREKDNNYGFRRVLSAGLIDQQPISDDYVNGERGLDERVSSCRIGIIPRVPSASRNLVCIIVASVTYL